MKRCWCLGAAITTGSSVASGPERANVENARLRERIKEEFARSRQTYGSPRWLKRWVAQGAVTALHADAPGANLCPAAFQISGRNDR